MQLIALEATDSTSLEAQRRLHAGQKVPFAVWARAQSAGRGRLGRPWQSLEGNLFITFVLPPQATELTALTPLRAAVVCAQLVYEQTGIRPGIKWPNDLILAGRKLGGLLCETSTSGVESGALFIGLGLNLRAAPIQGVESPAISVSAFRSPPIELAELAQAFSQRFLQIWDSLDDPQGILSAHREFAVGPGQIWVRSSDGLLGAETGLSERGELQLQELTPAKAGPTISIGSVSHGWRLGLQQADKRLPMVLADVGNSRLKLAYFQCSQDAEPQEVLSLSHESLLDLQQGLDLILKRLAADLGQAHLPWPIHWASVASPKAEPRNLFAQRGFSLVPVPKRSVLLQPGPYPIAQLGIDRLALMEGFLAEHSSVAESGEVVLVSAGTATTIDVLSTDGVHRGGLILPGMQFSINALARETGLLPRFQLDEWQFIELGREGTQSAMAAGVFQMTAAAVRTVKNQARRSGSGPVKVLVTGGAGSKLAQYLGVPYKPHLVLTGLRSIVGAGLAIIDFCQ